MNLDNLFEDIDYDSPLTDEELDYLDIIGKGVTIEVKDI